MKQLPTGLQVFETIRKGNGVYVDKTDMIYEIVSGLRRQYFLARPRRFGKSLTCWTLDALFSGKRELFEGLAISKTDWDWESYPVIHLDMSEVKTASGIDGVMESLRLLTKDVARKYEIDVGDITLPGSMLSRIIADVSAKFGKQAVVIVDEYDKPYIDFFAKPDMIQEAREIMRDYYATFKANEQHTRFLFMTGISKFAKMGVFSSLNNLADISLDKKFGAMFGYTEEELVANFGEYLELGAKELKITADELVVKMRDYYNGFCFDGVTKVYNPFSVLNFFHNYNFINHWMHSGNSRMLADYMKDRRLTVEQFIGIPVEMDFVNSPGDIETTPAEGFLYQAGYLTLRTGEAGGFLLDYPNTEVLNSMSRLVSNNIIQSGDRGSCFADFRNLTLDAMEDGDVALFVETINRLLASVPYDDYADGAKRAIRRSGLPAHEWLYRSNILTFLRGCGIVALAETHTSKGRSDLVICHGGAAWVIEIKVAYNDDGKTLAQEALQQLNAKQYADTFKTAKKLGIAIDDKTRQISDWAAG